MFLNCQWLQEEVSRHPYGMGTILQVFRNNATLCAGISDRVVAHTFKSIDRQGRQAVFVQFLRSVIKVDDVVQRYGPLLMTCDDARRLPTLTFFSRRLSGTSVSVRPQQNAGTDLERPHDGRAQCAAAVHGRRGVRNARVADGGHGRGHACDADGPDVSHRAGAIDRRLHRGARRGRPRTARRAQFDNPGEHCERV